VDDLVRAILEAVPDECRMVAANLIVLKVFQFDLRDVDLLMRGEVAGVHGTRLRSA
jgi:hypothetical protein